MIRSLSSLSLTACLGFSLVATTPAEALAAVKKPKTAPKLTACSPCSSQDFQQGLNAFGFNLYKQLKNSQDNLCFSPLSLAEALAMTSAGAKGSTEKDFYTVLKQNRKSGPLHPHFATLHQSLREATQGAQWQRANSLWLDKGFEVLAPFQSTLSTHYQASTQNFDASNPTESAQKMNTWAKEATKGQVQDLVRPSDIKPRLTRLALLNAIYFKGQWATAFNKAETKSAAFYQTATNVTQVPTMHRNGTFSYAEVQKVQVLDLPYKDSTLSLTVVLPRDRQGLDALENVLSPSTLKTWTEKLQESALEVALPKFTLRTHASLEKALQNLGLKRAFSSSANFQGISKGSINIDKVLHGAFLEIDEEGTEAAAATAVTMTRKAPEPRIPFKADHPFLFLLRDRTTGTVLFMGCVRDIH